MIVRSHLRHQRGGDVLRAVDPKGRAVRAAPIDSTVRLRRSRGTAMSDRPFTHPVTVTRVESFGIRRSCARAVSIATAHSTMPTDTLTHRFAFTLEPRNSGRRTPHSDGNSQLTTHSSQLKHSPLPRPPNYRRSVFSSREIRTASPRRSRGRAASDVWCRRTASRRYRACRAAG